jgi:sulfatase modifying factor 1
MRVFIAALLMVGCATTAAQSDPMKVPAGCRAAKDANTSHQGYADRVVHEKTGIELILVLPGKFDMGMTPSRAADVTYPKTIGRSFYMGRTEVTNGQFRRFVQESGYQGRPDVDPDPDYDLYLRHWRGKSIMSPDDDFPVVWVSWRNAKAFCQWSGLDLPTEAQWEYACRAGTDTLYYFGNDREQFHDYGWAHAGRDSENHYTHPVARKLPNAWGLHDMLGNVWEWVEDDWRENLGGSPTDGSARRIDGALTKVVRGGSWGNSSSPHLCGNSARYNSAPTNAGPEFGFRVILPLKSVSP